MPPYVWVYYKTIPHILIQVYQKWWNYCVLILLLSAALTWEKYGCAYGNTLRKQMLNQKIIILWKLSSSQNITMLR